MQQPRDKHCGRCWKLDHLEEEVATRSIIPLKHNSKSPRVQRKAERICGKQGSTPHLREIYGIVETREFFSQETLLEAPNTPQNRSTSNNCYQNTTVSQASGANLPPFHYEALNLPQHQRQQYSNKNIVSELERILSLSILSHQFQSTLHKCTLLTRAPSLRIFRTSQ